MVCSEVITVTLYVNPNLLWGNGVVTLLTFVFPRGPNIVHQSQFWSWVRPLTLQINSMEVEQYGQTKQHLSPKKKKKQTNKAAFFIFIFKLIVGDRGTWRCQLTWPGYKTRSTPCTFTFWGLAAVVRETFLSLQIN